MLLSYTELLNIVADGVIDAPLKHINPASIEVTLGNSFYIEKRVPWIVNKETKAVELFTDLANKQNIRLEKIILGDGEMLILRPGQVALAETVEEFNLPNNLTAEYVLKSSQARNFMSHENAGFCDAGWHSSKLTMEFKNSSEYGYLMLTPGQKCGQMKFVRVTEVPEDKSYAVVGQYNHQKSVQESKGLR